MDENKKTELVSANDPKGQTKGGEVNNGTDPQMNQNTEDTPNKHSRIQNRRKRFKRYPYRKEKQTYNTQNLNLANKMISVVIPLYNEEGSIVELSIQLKKVLGSLKANYEVIFIDDGSTDKSFQKIKEIHQLNNRFKCIKFRRNYGKSAALSEGFKAVKGDFVVTMDADLQDDPEEIPALIQKLNEGFDLVSGWKKKRFDPFIKKHTSKLFNLVTGSLVGLKLHDYNCGLKIYRKEVVKSLNIYGELHRYIPALAHFSGFKVTEVPVTHHPRKWGKTKFGASRFVNGLFDLLTLLFTNKYIKRPLHFFGLLGLISFMFGTGLIVYLTLLKFISNIPISNRPLFFIGIMFAILGIQFISIGLIGEMITKTTAEKDVIIIEQTLT
jgi:glycosyltransferase involved in cell wall biosynthesis